MPRDRSKARELQERKKKGSVDELQQRLEKESAELKKSRLDAKAKIESIKNKKRKQFLDKVTEEVPTLYLGIFIPVIFAVITICTATVATSISGNNPNCRVGLDTYLNMSWILAYFFLFGVSMMFIGSQLELPTCCGKIDLPDCRCKSLKSVKIFYGFTFAAALGVNLQGLIAFSQAAPCVDTAPLLYNMSALELFFFYGAVVVLLIFGCNAAARRAKNAAKNREAKKKADLERKIAAEYDDDGEEGGGGGGEEGDEEEYSDE
eukprot:g7887.t1